MSKDTSSVHRIWKISAVVVVALGVIIFGAYWYNLRHISSDHAAWSSFGSLLSGFFTLGGVIATIATLLFLNAQNKNHQDFIDWQKQAMSFDQYINHRKFFVERLNELQTVCDNKIRFTNPDHLYSAVFPDNFPTKINLIVVPKREDGAENLLGDLCNRLEYIESAFERTKWDDHSVREFAYDLITVQDHLQFEWIGEDSDGDILFEERNTGLNIYSIIAFCSTCSLILNSFLQYAGNRPIEHFQRGNPRFVREAFIKSFSRPMKDSLIRAHKSIDGLSSLEYLLFHVDSIRNSSKGWVLPMTYRSLERAFSSKSEVLKLRDDNVLSRLIQQGIQEVEWSLGIADNVDNPKTFQDLMVCAQMFDAFNDVLKNA